MKKILSNAACFIVFCLILGAAAIAPAQKPPIAGGYQKVAKTEAAVVAAANFAVERQGKKDASLKLVSIERAERQIVAGSNYRLCLVVNSQNQPQEATVIVYHDLQNQFQLTSWTNQKCPADAENQIIEETDESLIVDDVFKGTLHVMKTNSYFVYAGEESGDYAAFCFMNNSEVGRAVLAKCKDGDTCQFTGKVDQGAECKVDKDTQKILSGSGRILSVKSVKLLTVADGAAARKNPSENVVLPDKVVRNLYAAHDADRSPFFQTKSRALIDKYFTRDLADLIWKDLIDTPEGEVGALDFDPLYAAQDTKITGFKIGKPMYGEGNLEVADVPVTFKNFGKDQTILFKLEKGADKTWKISDVFYPDSSETDSSLTKILSP